MSSLKAIEIALSWNSLPVWLRPPVPFHTSRGSRLEKPPNVTRARLSRATSEIALWTPPTSWLARTTARSFTPSGWLRMTLVVV